MVTEGDQVPGEVDGGVDINLVPGGTILVLHQKQDTGEDGERCQEVRVKEPVSCVGGSVGGPDGLRAGLGLGELRNVWLKTSIVSPESPTDGDVARVLGGSWCSLLVVVVCYYAVIYV